MYWNSCKNWPTATHFGKTITAKQITAQTRRSNGFTTAIKSRSTRQKLLQNLRFLTSSNYRILRSILTNRIRRNRHSTTRTRQIHRLLIRYFCYNRTILRPNISPRKLPARVLITFWMIQDLWNILPVLWNILPVLWNILPVLWNIPQLFQISSQSFEISSKSFEISSQSFEIFSQSFEIFSQLFKISSQFLEISFQFCKQSFQFFKRSSQFSEIFS